MALCNFQFFLWDIAVDLDDLHAVKQRTAHGRQAVGRSDEQNPGKVVIHIQIVVVEMTVLLRVEHL